MGTALTVTEWAARLAAADFTELHVEILRGRYVATACLRGTVVEAFGSTFAESLSALVPCCESQRVLAEFDAANVEAAQ